LIPLRALQKIAAVAFIEEKLDEPKANQRWSLLNA
jgi:hypothetical protein